MHENPAGLRNTAARLNYLYADETRFTLHVDGAHVARATLTLPVLVRQPDQQLRHLSLPVTWEDYGERHHASADRG